MTRLRLLAVGTAVVAVVAACSSSPEAPPIDPHAVGWVDAAPPPAAANTPPPPQPNIVFVLTDDLTWNLVRYMPNVQAMQRDGVTFDNYFVTDSFCCPSRASIFTGEFPHDTGVFTNGGEDGGFKAFVAHHDQDRSFPVELNRAGYLTAFYGKFLNLYSLKVPFNDELPWIAPGWSAWGAAAGGYSGFNYQMAVGHDIDSFGTQPWDYLTNVVGNKARNFIAESAAARRPFMAEIATFSPHSPFRPAPRDAGRFLNLRAPQAPSYGRAVTHPPAWLGGIPPLTPTDERQLNDAFVKRVQTVQAVDRMIGKLRTELRRLGIEQNTYVVFSSDNGMHLGEHNLRQGKQTAFDTDIRVPLIITGPGVDAGKTVAEMTENVDLAPSFEALAGRTPPPNIDGRSLVPLLDGPAPDDWRDAILVEHHGPLSNPSDPDYQPYPAGKPPSYEAIRTRRYLYVTYAYGEHEFYDLTTDPNELHNRFATIPLGLWLRLQLTLNRLSTCHGSASCWAAEHLRM